MLEGLSQLVLAVVYGAVEFFLSLGITKIVCEWWDLHERHAWMSQDQILLIVTLLIVLTGVLWMKKRTQINEFLIGLVSVLVPVLVCLNVS